MKIIFIIIISIIEVIIIDKISQKNNRMDRKMLALLDKANISGKNSIDFLY